MQEPTDILQWISEITGGKYSIARASERHPVYGHAIWLIQASDIETVRRIPSANSVWKEEDESVWIESISLGDSIDWIESAYGEEAAGRSLEIDYSDFDSQEFQERFKMEYPRVYRRMQAYEDIGTQVSKANKIDLKFRKRGSKEIASFSYAVRLAPDEKDLKERLRTGVEALQEAWDRSDKLEVSSY